MMAHPEEISGEGRIWTGIVIERVESTIEP